MVTSKNDRMTNKKGKINFHGEEACLRKSWLTRPCYTSTRYSEDSQDADKLVLPSLGGDRGGR